MRTLKHIIILVISFILLATIECGAATTTDFVGLWRGTGTFVAAGETNSGTMTVRLSKDGSSLVGLVVYDCKFSITGPVQGGVFTFAIHPCDEDIGDPDCANFDVSATATLDQSLKTMSINATGTFCGDGGGQPGTLSATLSKTTETTYFPLLLKDN